jgi:hypothetical protein
MVNEVNRETLDLKQQDFIKRSKVVMCELEHQDQLRELGVAQVFSISVQNTMTWVSFFINVCINVVSLQFLAMPPGDYDATTKTYKMGTPELSDATADRVQLFLNLAQIACSAFTLVLYLIVRSPVVYKNEQAKKGSSKLTTFLAVVHPFNGLTPYYFFYLVFAVMGMERPVLNGLLMFDILIKNSTTRDVLHAVTKPVKQIAATALLLLITIYICAFVYFLTYRNHFDNNECDTLGKCFRLSVTYGLRYGGGVGDYLTSGVDVVDVERAVEVTEGSSRFWIDMMFFIVVVVILLNIFFGIIIDNFAELRDSKKEKMVDTKDFCFICGISANRFDKESPRAFDNHIKNDHYMWNYLKFMVHIWAQDPDDDDGLELHVREQIDRLGVDWLPMGVCMSMMKEGDAENAEQDCSNGRVQDLVRSLETAAGREARRLAEDARKENSHETMLKETQQLNEHINSLTAKVDSLILASLRSDASPLAVVAANLRSNVKVAQHNMAEPNSPHLAAGSPKRLEASSPPPTPPPTPATAPEVGAAVGKSVGIGIGDGVGLHVV